MKILKSVKLCLAYILVFMIIMNLYGCALLSKDTRVKDGQTEQNVQDITYKLIEKDKVEKYALKLQEEIIELTNHYNNGRSEAVKKDADNVIKLLEDSQETMADYQKEVEDTIVSLKSDTLLQRQKDYEKEYSEKTEKTKILLHQIANAENDDAMEKEMTDLNALFEEEKPEVYSSAPENLAENVEIQSEEVGDIDTYEANMQDKMDTSTESESDAELLELANETNVTDAIKKKAEELKTPLNIYNYLKNTLDYEWYYGSRKGAGQTYETLAGNDKDQASLLIAMLRYLGYKARYVDGSILLKEEQIKNLTGAKDIRKGADALASAGVPVTVLTSGGKATAVSLEHTWVEAYLPYSDYRGAGNNAGDYLWIPLDTGIQEYKTVDTVYEYCDEQNITADWQDALKNGNTADVEEIIEQLEQNISEEETENLYITSRVKKEKNVSYLPLSLQYSVLEKKTSYASVAMEDTDTVEFFIAGKSLGKYQSYELLGKRITIEYVAKTQDDEKVLDQYGSIFKVPTYLVKMCPVLKFDGKEIAKGASAVLGAEQNFTMKITSSGTQSEVSNAITAGSLYQVTLDAQTISGEELEKSYEEYKALKETATVDNVYSEEYLGKVLDVAGKMYFAQLDIANRMLGEQYQVKETRSLSEGMTGYEVQTSYLYGTPVGLSEGSLFIDVDRDAHSAVSLTGDETAENKFMRTSGMISSMYESTIWEELTGAESISTMSILKKAQEEGTDIFVLNSKNYEKTVDKLEVDEDVLQDVAKAVRNGKEVTIPAKEVEIGSWSGSGYIVMDPATGAASYMISGGLNGGSCSGIVTIEAILGLILAALSIAELVIGIVGLLTALASLTIFGWAVLVLEIYFLITITMFMVELLCDYYDYVDGDEQVGDKIIKETEAFAIITLLFVSIGKILKLFGIDIESWLNSKMFKPETSGGSGGTGGSGNGEGSGEGGTGDNGGGKGDEGGSGDNGSGKGDEGGTGDNGSGKGDEGGSGDNGGGKGDEGGTGDSGGGKGDEGGSGDSGSGKGDEGGSGDSGSGKGDEGSSGNESGINSGKDLIKNISKIEYGSDELSSTAIKYRKMNSITSARRNVCVVEYKNADGTIAKKEFVSNAGNHSEELMIEFLKENKVLGEDVLRIFTEREPCVETVTNVGHNCTNLIIEYAPDAEVTYAVDYGVTQEDGLNARNTLQGLLQKLLE